MTKEIKNYEGCYTINDTGEVWSVERWVINHKSGSRRLVKSRKLKPCKDKDGYLFVHLSASSILQTAKIHRLVATAFIPNPENKPEVNHLDYDRSNNILSNLEWATMLENRLHGRENTLPRKEDPNCIIVLNTEMGIFYNSAAEAGKSLGHNRKWMWRRLVGKVKNNTSLIIA